jgi:hypothetical protein
MDKILNESELQDKMIQIYKEEQYKVIQEKWEKLSGKDKRFVLEMLRQTYPDKANLISEAKWYNTLGDIVGIFDPTGVVDLINGISYWRQGDKLFAVLSWISVIPYIGDLIAKPVVGLFKMGGASAKAFKAASLAGDAAKMAQIAKKGGPLAGLVTKVSSWAPRILEPLARGAKKIPGVGPGLVKSVEDYIKLFKDASKTMSTGAVTATKLTAKSNKLAKQGLKLTPAEARQLKDALKAATQFRGFRNLKGVSGWQGGVGRLWGNRSTRTLMIKTKWYLGLLDFLGVANFVGPEELETQFEDLDSKVAEYNNTPEAKQYWTEDVGEGSVAQQPPSFENIPSEAPTPPSNPKPSQSDDFLSALFT